MIVFPIGRNGKLTLAGEIVNLYQEGLFEIIISEEVVGELLEVIHEEFPDAYAPQLSFFFRLLFHTWPESRLLRK